jgi:hypothetical protein
MKLKMAADQVLKRFSRQIRKEDAYRPDPFSSALPLLWEATVNNLMIIIDRSVST